MGVRTVYNAPLGNPHKLQQELSLLGIHKEVPYQEGYGFEDIGVIRWFSYFLFDFIPSYLLRAEPPDPYQLLPKGDCKPILSDIPVLISVWNWDFPSYSFILGKRYNLLLRCDEEDMSKAVPVVGRNLSVYIYSPKGFFLGDKEVPLQSVLTLNTEGNTLVLVWKNQELWGVYPQSGLSLVLTEEGIYRVEIFSYKLRVWNIFMGLRFVSCLPPFKVQAM
ncbi:hypothetical protein Thal_0196 [Thermocrinis albus DSM 14484]|uniref:Uncharacterized protein n=1 Tax=Thermocrinis albus (strain DSM 14484 / JCM 11386 / HI 11/12) TaxID=638303 RepID=D3SNU4_THEAH|nr:hypothetical protein Thal_0196 [Thermocrinis albus DSM 14484]